NILDERCKVAVDEVVRGLELEKSSEVGFEPLGQLPRGWKYARLRSIECDVQTGPFGSQLHAEDYINGAWPVVNPANIHANGLVADPSVTVDDEVRDRLSSHILRKGDVVFARRGELG